MSQGHGCSYEHVRPAIIIFTQWESIKTSMIDMCMHLIFHLCRSIQTVLLLLLIIRVVCLHLDECSLWFDPICWMKVYSPIFLSFFLSHNPNCILSVCSFPLVDGDVACGGALTWYFIKLFQCVCVCVCVCVCLSLSLTGHCLFFIPQPVVILLSLFYFPLAHHSSSLPLFLSSAALSPLSTFHFNLLSLYLIINVFNSVFIHPHIKYIHIQGNLINV